MINKYKGLNDNRGVNPLLKELITYFRSNQRKHPFEAYDGSNSLFNPRFLKNYNPIYSNPYMAGFSSDAYNIASHLGLLNTSENLINEAMFEDSVGEFICNKYLMK